METAKGTAQDQITLVDGEKDGTYDDRGSDRARQHPVEWDLPHR